MPPDPKQTPTRCPDCWQPSLSCFCAKIRPLSTRVRFLILQHPQEAKKPLSTARLASRSLPAAVHRVGLSWRSFANALGAPVDPKTWAVLYLGGRNDSKQALAGFPYRVLNRRGDPVSAPKIDGVIVLDGSWKQSKTLWWRNPWLLKLNRLLLNPDQPSLYRAVRRQPRKECLATIEAIALCLTLLDNSSQTPDELRRLFRQHLVREDQPQSVAG